jgi:hypothetical protein
MRRKPSTTIAVTAAAFVVTGGLAFAAVSSVADTPSPQVVVPSSSSTHDPAGHDAGDDNGGTRTQTSRADTSGTDDPAGHDAGDDNGGSTTGVATATATTDDHGGSGSGRSSGSGSSGSDDSGGHGSDG